MNIFHFSNDKADPHHWTVRNHCFNKKERLGKKYGEMSFDMLTDHENV